MKVYVTNPGQLKSCLEALLVFLRLTGEPQRWLTKLQSQQDRDPLESGCGAGAGAFSAQPPRAAFVDVVVEVIDDVTDCIDKVCCDSDHGCQC